MASPPIRPKRNREQQPPSRPPSYYEDFSSITPSLPSTQSYLANQQQPQSSVLPAQQRQWQKDAANNNVHNWSDRAKSGVPRASWAAPSSTFLESPVAQSRTAAAPNHRETDSLPPAYHHLDQTPEDVHDSKSRRALDFSHDDGPPPYEAVVTAEPGQYYPPPPQQKPEVKNPRQQPDRAPMRNGPFVVPTSAAPKSVAAANRMMVSNFPSSAANDIVARRAARYRSNSSLELDRIVGVDAGSGEEDGRAGGGGKAVVSPATTISRSSRRDYGSTSSIDVMGSNNEFFEMVKNYATDQSLDQRSPAPAAIRDILQGAGIRASGAVSRSSGPIHDVQVDFDLDDDADGNLASDSAEIPPGGAGTMSDTEGTGVNQSPRIKSKSTKIKERKQNRSKSVIQDQSTATASFFGKLRGGGGGSGGVTRQIDFDAGLANQRGAELFSSGFPPEVIFPPDVLRGVSGAPLAAALGGDPRTVLFGAGGGDQATNSSVATGATAATGDGGGSTRRTVMHHDLQSVMFSFHDVIASKRLAASQRRNTTTGASAASAVGSGGGRVHGGGAKEGTSLNANNQNDTEYDAGDDKNNALVKSCPFFRNELGGENFNGLFNVSLIESPFNASCVAGEDDEGATGRAVGKEADVDGLLGSNSLIEHCDRGALYYRNYFHGREHQNYFGNDENFGPVAISIKRERIDGSNGNNDSTSSSQSAPSFNFIYKYRVIVRTSELRTLRGAILEDDVPSASRHGGARGLPHKDVLEAVTPELQISALKVAQTGEKVQEQLIKLDEQGISTTYKVGIMYCQAGQSSEEEMYNNESSGPNFDQFLNLLGEKVRLKGFEKYRAQLDNKTDSTGTHSLYSCFDGCEIMFHVSTLLPYTQNNRQQLLRKRHIGNDIVTIVFQEPGALPFTPKAVRSQFQHVFIVVQVMPDSKYGVAVSRSKDVPPFGPPIPAEGIFEHSFAFRDFLLAKVINAENAAHKSEKFRAMATRTRQEYLKDLAANYITSTTLESSSKFAKFSMKKKDRPKSHVPPCESRLSPAVVWSVCLEDLFGSYKRTPCYLAISSSAVALVDKITGDIISFIVNSNVIGWTESEESLKLYYDRGSCLLLQLHLVQDKRDIVNRLCQVSSACLAKDISLKRNGLGQLGFHVYSQGLVMDVEPYGLAWQSGLRPGSRLLEICKAMVIELTHEEMVELLRTSVVVTVLAVEPMEDGSPRGITDDGETSEDSILTPSTSQNVTLDDAALPYVPVTSSTMSSQSSKASNSSDRKVGPQRRSQDHSFEEPSPYPSYHAGNVQPQPSFNNSSRTGGQNYEMYSSQGFDNHLAGTMNSNHSSASTGSAGSGLIRDVTARSSLEGRQSNQSGPEEHQPTVRQQQNGLDMGNHQSIQGTSHPNALSATFSQNLRRDARGNNLVAASSFPKPSASDLKDDNLRTSSRSSHASSNPISSQAGSKQGSYEYLSMWSGESSSTKPPEEGKRIMPPPPQNHSKEPQPQSQPHSASHAHYTANPPLSSAVSRAPIQTPQVQSSLSSGIKYTQQHQQQLIAPSSSSAFSPVAPRVQGIPTKTAASPKSRHQEPSPSASNSDPQLLSNFRVDDEKAKITTDATSMTTSVGPASQELQAFSRRSKLYSSERVFDPSRRATSGSSAYTRSRPPLPTAAGTPSGNTPTHRRDKSDGGIDSDLSPSTNSGATPTARSHRQQRQEARLGSRPIVAQRLSPRCRNDMSSTSPASGVTTSATATPPASCSFQEELMRLIDPDIPESELQNNATGKSGSSTPKRYRPPLHRTLSDESLSGGGATVFARSSALSNNASNNQGLSPRHSTVNVISSSSSSDAVFTAKPAQIVSPRNLRDEGPSFTTSSSDRLYPQSTFPNAAPTKFSSPQSLPHSSALGAAGPPGRQSTTASIGNPAANPATSSAFPLPEAAAGNIEWNNLVDAANRVIRDSDLELPPTSLTPLSTSLEQLQAGAVAGPTKPARDPSARSQGASSAAGAALNEPESFQATELAKQLQELQQQLQRERLGRATLEEEVSYLRSDNERLTEESQTAAAQLRKFTEWFFTTIDKS